MHKAGIPLIILLTPLWARASMSILVPAYFDPSASNDWNVLTASVSPGVPITAIMNPNSGPVGSVDPSYTSAINNFQAAGGKVVAYVHTTNGNRPLASVENEIATYKAQYPNINGIFIDEMDNTLGTLQYYQNLYSYIKTQNANWQAIGNPGTDTIPNYLSPTPAADELITFENNTGYSTYTEPAWENSFNPSKFGNIVYNVPNVATMQNYLSLAAGNHAGNVYFTDLNGANPYLALPSYWSSEVAAVRLANLRSVFTHNGAGDFNVSDNWSSIVPDGTDGEADFLSAMTANHTVYSDVPITLGKIVFNNTKTYVLAGAGSLTMRVSTGSALITAQAGTQKVSLPITVDSNTTLNADAGATLVVIGPITVNAGNSLSQTGTGSVQIKGALTLNSGGSASLLAGASIGSLNLMDASSASIVAGAAGNALAVDQLSLLPTAKFDLQANDLIVHNGDLAAIESWIYAGANGSVGIVAQPGQYLSTYAAIINSGNQSSFDGQSVTATDVLVRYSTFGDANLDGVVNQADYLLIDSGFVGDGNGWANGDFNYDGRVDGSDYSLIDNSFNRQLAVGTGGGSFSTSEVAVPEPGVSVLLFGVLVLRSRKRR